MNVSILRGVQSAHKKFKTTLQPLPCEGLQGRGKVFILRFQGPKKQNLYEAPRDSSHEHDFFNNMRSIYNLGLRKNSKEGKKTLKDAVAKCHCRRSKAERTMLGTDSIFYEVSQRIWRISCCCTLISSMRSSIFSFQRSRREMTDTSAATPIVCPTIRVAQSESLLECIEIAELASILFLFFCVRHILHLLFLRTKDQLSVSRKFLISFLSLLHKIRFPFCIQIKLRLCHVFK